MFECNLAVPNESKILALMLYTDGIAIQCITYKFNTLKIKLGSLWLGILWTSRQQELGIGFRRTETEKTGYCVRFLYCKQFLRRKKV